MPILTVALGSLAIAVPILAYARLRGDGGNVGKVLFVFAVLSSFLFGCGIALSALSGVLHLFETYGVPTVRSHWLSIALGGALAGVIVHATLRILFYRLAELSAHWALRKPRIKEQKLVHQLRSTVWEIVGFALAFAIMFLIADSANWIGRMWPWLLLPIFAATVPLYETLILPWLRFLGAPKLTGRNLSDIDEWLADLCANRQIPSFRIRVQEGNLANAFTIGGLFRHLIVIGGGLIDGMTTSQIKAVVAHEIAHVIRRDVLRLLLPMAVASGTCWLFCVWHYANPLFAANTVPGILAGCAIAGLSAVTFMIAVPSYFMRRMEYRADLLAVELIGDGEALVDALRALAALNEEPIRQGYWSHPSTHNRIRAIQRSNATV
ncbi:MAG: M48 family metalloprotease [Gammaproteobacteria bacterium]|nr:M48 family metalloprotease [Gammaproteobacteria bacterium]